jgi:hypothetical protein
MPKVRAKSTNGRNGTPHIVLDPRSPSFSRNFRRAAKAFTKRATASPEAALAVLVKEGILTPSGRLSKNYR